MPLAKGKSQKTISKNIKEMMDDFKYGDGKIESTKPKNKAQALNIAKAAAMNTAYGPKKKAKKK